ncbi:MAG: GH36-type glycosyl hydrolase domain-containing protein [Roseburia sp.]
MENYDFLDDRGTFTLKNPENYSCLYFPIAGEAGLKSSLTPELGGDAKINQNTFLLEPVSAENLHSSRSTRNFWCHVKELGNWSATGVSGEEINKRYTDMQDKSELTAGLMWQTVVRESLRYQLRAEITSFVPVDSNVEIMHVIITNIGKMQCTFVPTAAIPIYGRSADNIRDHRHVTSLLHRITTTEYGVEVTPTLSFDERGHRHNDVTYFVCGIDGKGAAPVGFHPVVEEFIGEGGNFERPLAVIRNEKGVKAGLHFEGQEAMGGLRFAEVILEPDESISYTILLGATKQRQEIAALIDRFSSEEKTCRELEEVKEYWQKKVNVAYRTSDRKFDEFMHWVSFQPILRRIYGCSFLPHHDYGKGGRGWRDLWQDCLALLILNPVGVRQMLLDNFAGVRMDGSNATIIGNGQGEFIADRNNITRVWMDHGVWPYITTKLYIDQTGDLELLEKEVPYFKDKQIGRGTDIDTCWTESYGSWQKTDSGEEYRGSVLEHLLLQHLTAFYEVGEHNEIRLRGADWNDALDMAPDRGESVAFTNAYAGNMKSMAELLLEFQKKTGKQSVKLSKNILILLEEGEQLYESPEKKRKVLEHYLSTCRHEVSGEKTEISIALLSDNLAAKAAWMMRHIRETEWVEDEEKNGWFNGYYDNHGRRVEGEFASGVRMMLTGQVFSVMAGTADEEQIKAITKSADKHLYCEEVGGYRLNTDFGEIKNDLGRMFGFSYGDKENGAVFSHMAVMYANALYMRGFAKEGYKALKALEKQAMNFNVSRIYPGIPEYFNGRGRGMYHYLTGAASWYMLTVITEMFGVKGRYGDLVLEPKLLREQFDDERKAELFLCFQGKRLKVTYRLETDTEYGLYKIRTITLDGKEPEAGCVTETLYGARIAGGIIESLDETVMHQLEITLSEGKDRKL